VWVRFFRAVSGRVFVAPRPPPPGQRIVRGLCPETRRHALARAGDGDGDGETGTGTETETETETEAEAEAEAETTEGLLHLK